MKRRLFISLCMAVLACATIYAQTAVLVRNNQPVGAFSGVNSLINAVNAAEASGDLIILGSGTFNVPSEINKAVSIYGQGFEDASTRTYLNNKLQYRSTGEGSLDNIHLEGLYISNHLNLLNDGNRSPMNNLTIEKCFITGMFLYMDNNGTTIRNCVMQGDLKSYPGDYKATNMLIENCWKDGGSFNHFIADSKITIKNSIFYCRSISGFDNSSAFINATYENSVIASCSLAANSIATNCVLIGVNSANATTTDCQTASSVTEAFENVTTLVYSAGTVPTLKSDYAGIGITAGDYAWNTTPSRPTVNFETTLVKDADGFYKIGTAADWIELKRVVENIEPMANAKMTADINLGDEQAMIGNGHFNTEAYRRAFGGIFDGQGHTLTINFVSADILQKLIEKGFTEPTYLGCAPFGYVCGGTIRNLNTAGTITSTHEGVAGIVGWTEGSTLIENCHSSVDLEITNGYRGLGGIIYNTLGNGELTIRDCIYDGTLAAGSNKTGAAGFFVMRGGGKASVFNSLLLATYANGLGTSDCVTFVRNGLGGGIISNCFYKTALGEAQGVQATANELANGRTAFYLQAGRANLVWGQKIGEDPYPVLTNDESKRVYRSADGYTNNPTEAISNQDLVQLTYTRDADNNLTITGFDQGFTPPDNYNLVIPDDIDGSPVVAIANSAFYQKSNFTSLYIGKNVKTIGNEAFRQAKGMASVTFAPDCVVESFGNSAFRGCDELTSFTMPNTVKTIGEMCFQANPKLTTVTISNQLSEIASRAFAQNPLLNNVNIPASVNTIKYQAFYQCSGLTSIEFPANVTKLEEDAFRDCSGLTTVTIPSTITSMDKNVFWNSGVKTADVYCTVLGQGAFYQCVSLESVTIHEGVTTLGLGAFHGCTKLKPVNIPQSVTTMNENVFRDCSALTTVNFANGILLETIPNAGFYNSGLTSINIPASVTTIGNDAFGRCASLPSITIPVSMTSIGTSAFSGCSLLATVTFADGINLETIPASCFYECRALESISIPVSVTKIDNEAFRRCSAMISVNFLSNTALTTIGDGAFRGCAELPSIVIPESVETIGSLGFQACTNLEQVTLPSTLKVISNQLFQESKLSNDFVIPNSVTTIGESAFKSTTALGSITIPASVKTIGSSAFYDCKQLESVTLPVGLTTIGNSAFRYCEKLNDVVLPSSLVTIQDWAFANCTGMENLTIEEGISNINRDVFQYSGMKNVVLPSTIEAIGVNLFYQCNQLEVLDLSKCVNVWELYSYTSLRGGSYNITYGVPNTTKIILPPYATATLGNNDEVATLTFDLQQDSEDYFLINNATDWDKFVAYSRSDPTINGRLTADLDLTNHKGKLGVGNGESNYITYQGTFDGQGHKLTINYKTGKDVSGGLFAYVENATIKNLKVEGNVTANNRLIGGFVGFVKPSTTLTMQDCESAVHFTVTPTTTNMHIAGFIGQGKTSTVTLTDCLFTGSITGNTSFRYAAAFLGWMESAGRITYNYCLNNGTFTNTDKTFTYALGATNSSGQSTSAVCYFKDGNVGNNETKAIAVIAEQLASGMVTYRLQGGRSDQHWGQLLGRDPYPLLTNEEGTLVYRGQTYTNEYVEYAGLQKDEDDYYLIGGAADWEEFCLVVEEFPLSNARMTADVEVVDNSTVGSATNDNGRYNGTFDGQGYTLTVNYPFTAYRYSSPFANIEGATIKNLHVDGTINSAWCHGGGLVANSWGTNTIENVWVSADIKSSVSGWDECGAFVGCMKNGTLNITNSLFTGSISAGSSNNGGFIGYRDGGTSILTNCLSTGTFNYTGGGNDFTRGTTVTNCYYSGTFNGSANNITQVTDEQLASGQITYKLQGKSDDLIWAQTIGIDEQPMLALFATDALRVYRATIDSYTNDPNETILPVDADGYYQIASLDDWKTVSMLVAEGEEDAKVKMIADIDLGNDQTKIGNPNAAETTNYFKGIFDGQGHTLIINYVQNGPQGYNTAPFPNISCATIKNVHFDGTITNDCNTQPSIVGNCRFGTSYLENIWSSVTTTSNSNYEWTEAAAFVSCVDGYKQGHLVMSDCLFTGAIQGTPTYAGVFIGYINSGGSASISNCLSTGTFQTGGNPGIRGDYTNCYVLQFTGSIPSNMQCTSTTLADGTITTALQAGREEEIWIQDDSTGQPILALFKKNNGIATGLRVITDDDNDTWFTLEGMKLDTKPKQQGVYIKNGKRVVIK